MPSILRALTCLCVALLFGALAFLLLRPAPLHALDTSITTCDWSTFKTAVDQVQQAGGGAIDIDCSGVIDFPNMILVTSTLALHTSQPVTFTQSNSVDPDDMRHFRITSGNALTLTGLVLMDAGYPLGDGGSIYANSGSSLFLEHTTMRNNATGAGGAIYANNARIMITDSVLLDNSAESFGGNLYGVDSSIAITNSVVAGGRLRSAAGGSANGGGISSVHSHVSLQNVEFRNNQGRIGGAVSILSNSTLAARQITVADNLALYGGGLSVRDSSAFVTQSTFTSNQATHVASQVEHGGAAIYTSASHVGLENTQISGNHSIDLPAALTLLNSSQVTMTFVTLVENDTTLNPGPSGVKVEVGSTLTMRNSVVDNPVIGAPSVDTPNCQIDGGATLVAVNSFATDASCGAATVTTSTGLQAVALDDGAEIYVPSASSPLVNGAANGFGITTDLLGQPRPVASGFDVGAIELQPAQLPPSGILLVPAAPNLPGAQPSGATIGILSTDDIDPAERYTYTVLSPSHFVVGGAANALTDTLKIGANPLARGVYPVTVRSTDSHGLSVQETFTVTLANQPPTGVTLIQPVPGLAGTQPANTVVGLLTTSDLDAGESFTYTILTSSSPFALSSAADVVTGTLQIGTSPLAPGAYPIALRSTDRMGASTQSTVTVTIHPPLEVNLVSPTTTFAGSVPNGALIGTLEVEGGDGSETFAFSTTASAAEMRLDPTLVVSGTAGNELRVGAMSLPVGLFAADVTAVGSGGSATSKTFTVTVAYDGVSHRWLPTILSE